MFCPSLFRSLCMIEFSRTQWYGEDFIPIGQDLLKNHFSLRGKRVWEYWSLLRRMRLNADFTSILHPMRPSGCLIENKDSPSRKVGVSARIGNETFELTPETVPSNTRRNLDSVIEPSAPTEDSSMHPRRETATPGMTWADRTERSGSGVPEGSRRR